MGWNQLENIRGPQGSAGSRGPKGDTGTKGDNLAVWTGTASQYSSVNKNAYDLYLVTS